MPKVDRDSLRPHPYNVQLYRQRTPTQRFIQDIAEKMEEPLIINQEEEIIDGVRRWLAASELGWESIEVIEKSYESSEAEKKAILRHNDDRDETFSQKMRVALEYEELVAPVLEERMKAGKPLDEQDDPRLESKEGETALDLAAARVGWGRTKYWQAKSIWEAKESGDNYARTLVTRLDAEDISVNAAYEELNEEQGKAGRREVPDEQRGVVLANGVPVEKIEANINNPEQAALVVNGNRFRSLLKQAKLPGRFGVGEDQFIHLRATKDGLSLETVAQIESVGEHEELRTEYHVPPAFFSQFTISRESVGMSLPIDDLLTYLGIVDNEDVRVQFHGEPDTPLASALLITDGDTQIYLHSPLKWTDDHLDRPEWIPEETDSS